MWRAGSTSILRMHEGNRIVPCCDDRGALLGADPEGDADMHPGLLESIYKPDRKDLMHSTYLDIPCGR
jgi:hypothetical protein